MPVPWLAVGKLVLSNLDTVIGVVKPVFTRRKADTPAASPSELLNQQIAELQAAASGNAEQIREIAAQMKQVVTALDQAALSMAAERRRNQKLAIAALAVALAALVVSVAALVSR